MNINDILKSQSVQLLKKYGQNFITDLNLLNAIVADAEIESDDTVIEVGAGAGTLTAALATKAKRVIAYEIDTRLKPVIAQTTGGLNNVEVIFEDFMDAEINALNTGNFKVVANLPYYITTPLIFKFLDEPNLLSLTVMVQKEVAERICAKPDTPEYGHLSVSVQSCAIPKITRIVGRKMFTPSPDVDSAVVRMDILRRDDISDYGLFKRVVKAGFMMRRKTLVNNLMSAFSLSRVKAEEAVAACGMDIKARGETLSPDKYVELTDMVGQLLKGN